MKIKARYSEQYLTAEAIDQIAEDVETFLYSVETERANVLRIRLSIEEALLRWQDHFGEKVKVVFVAGRHLRRPSINLEIKAESYDPLMNDAEDLSLWSQNLLSSVGLNLVYSYRKGVNVLQLRLQPHQRNPAFNLLVALAVGLLLGGLGNAFLPQTLRDAIIRTTLGPIQDVFFRVLNAAAGPIIFFTVLVAICGVGNIAAGGKAGRKMILRFMFLCASLAVIALLSSCLCFEIGIDVHLPDNEKFTSALDFFLQFIPNDVLTPLVTGNSPQIILVAVIIGNAILVAGNRTDGISTLLEQLNSIGLIIANWVGKFAPFFIVILLILGVWNRSISSLLGCWKPFLLFMSIIIVVLFLTLLNTGKRFKLPLGKLVNKLRPSFLVALRTASVDSAYGDNIFCCEKKLGISKSFVESTLPLGLVLYMPANTIATMVFSLYTAAYYIKTIDLIWIITILVLTVTLIMASPPLVGVNLLAYAAVFAQLGIPSEGLTIALIADVTFSFVAAAFNQAMLQMELIVQAKRQEQLNLSILQR